MRRPHDVNSAFVELIFQLRDSFHTHPLSKVLWYSTLPDDGFVQIVKTDKRLRVHIRRREWQFCVAVANHSVLDEAQTLLTAANGLLTLLTTDFDQTHFLARCQCSKEVN